MQFSSPKSHNRHCRRPRRRSNRLPVWLAVSCVFLIAGRTLGQDSTDDGAVRSLLDNQVAAWNRGDVDGFMQGYWDSDSTVFSSGGTLTIGYREVLSRYRKAYDSRKKMGVLKFSDLAIQFLSSKIAVAMGIWDLVRISNSVWGRFTLIIEKKPEGWRITHDHTSSAGK